MAQLIVLTKVGIFDRNGSRILVSSESIKVAPDNISGIEDDTLGSIVMLEDPTMLDGSPITGYVVTQTQAQIQTLIDTVSSTVAANDGTVSAPSISFASDTNTGIYRIGTDNIGVAANGAKVLDIATTGLGITGIASVSGTTDSTSKTTGAAIVSGGLGVAKAFWAGNFANVQGLIKRPVTTTTVAAGSLITGAMIATGYIEITGTTNSSALDSAANITTAIGTSPIGTTFDFTLNTIGATPMTATNVLTITAGAGTQFMKQISAGDSASAFLATVTATAGVHLAHFRVTYDTATTITIQRIG